MPATIPARKIVRNIGDSITIRGHIEAKIVKVWPFGTVDVEIATGARFRVTGLPIYIFDE